MFGDYNKILGLKNNIPYINPGSPRYLGYPVRVIEIGEGEGAAEKTVNIMIDIIKESSNNPFVRKWAEKLVRNLPPKDQMAEASAIYYFLRDNCRYTPDPIQLEYVVTPPLTLSKIENGEIPCIDCDDYTVTASSLLRSIGIPCRVVTTAYFNNPEWGHVYCEALIGNVNDGTLSGRNAQWVTIDPIKNDKSFGWCAPNPTRIKHYYIDE